MLDEAHGVPGSLGIGVLHEQLVQRVGLDAVFISPGDVLGAGARGIELIQILDGQAGIDDGVLSGAGPGLGLEVIGIAEGVAPVDIAFLVAVSGQELVNGLNAVDGHVGGNGGIAGHATLGIGLGAGNDHIAGIEAVSAVVGSLGVQTDLGRIDKILRGDGGAVIPGHVLTDGDAPRTGGVALRDIPLRVDVLAGHVFRIVSRSQRHDNVAVHVFVEIEVIQAVAQVGGVGAVRVGLLTHRIPHRGELRDGHVVGVGVLGGIAFSESEAGEHHARNQSQCEELLHKSIHPFTYFRLSFCKITVTIILYHIPGYCQALIRVYCLQFMATNGLFTRSFRFLPQRHILPQINA